MVAGVHPLLCAYVYSVDLPAGMITETGYCGMGGESDDAVMSQVWDAIWDIMDELTSVEWVAIEDEVN